MYIVLTYRVTATHYMEGINMNIRGIWYYAKENKAGFTIRVKTTDEVVCATTSARHASTLVNSLDLMEGNLALMKKAA